MKEHTRKNINEYASIYCQAHALASPLAGALARLQEQVARQARAQAHALHEQPGFGERVADRAKYTSARIAIYLV